MGEADPVIAGIGAGNGLLVDRPRAAGATGIAISAVANRV
jgi:hypothetical protein